MVFYPSVKTDRRNFRLSLVSGGRLKIGRITDCIIAKRVCLAVIVQKERCLPICIGTRRIPQSDIGTMLKSLGKVLIGLRCRFKSVNGISAFVTNSLYGITAVRTDIQIDGFRIASEQGDQSSPRFRRSDGMAVAAASS